MSRTKFMGIFLVILGVISIVVGIVRGDMFSSATMCIGYLLPIALGAVMLIVEPCRRRRDQAGDRPIRRGAGRRQEQEEKAQISRNENSRHPHGMAAVESVKKVLLF